MAARLPACVVDCGTGWVIHAISCCAGKPARYTRALLQILRSRAERLFCVCFPSVRRCCSVNLIFASERRRSCNLTRGDCAPTRDAELPGARSGETRRFNAHVTFNVQWIAVLYYINGENDKLRVWGAGKWLNLLSSLVRMRASASSSSTSVFSLRPYMGKHRNTPNPVIFIICGIIWCCSRIVNRFKLWKPEMSFFNRSRSVWCFICQAFVLFWFVLMFQGSN